MNVILNVMKHLNRFCRTASKAAEMLHCIQHSLRCLIRRIQSRFRKGVKEVLNLQSKSQEMLEFSLPSSATYNPRILYFVDHRLPAQKALLPLQSQTAIGPLETLKNANFPEKSKAHGTPRLVSVSYSPRPTTRPRKRNFSNLLQSQKSSPYLCTPLQPEAANLKKS